MSSKMKDYKLMDVLGKLTETTIPSPEVLEALMHLGEKMGQPASSPKEARSDEGFAKASPSTLKTQTKGSHSLKRPPGITAPILREDPS